MSSPRRSGFRLPWSGADRDPNKTDGDGAAVAEASEQPAPEPTEQAAAEAPSAKAAPRPKAVAEQPAATEAEPAQASAEPEPATAEPAAVAESAAEAAETTGEAEKGSEPRDLLRELVAAMRRVAEEARDADVHDLRPRVDDRLARLRTQAEEDSTAARERAETEEAAIGEWVKAEMERIKSESEARVAARRQQLEDELAQAERRVTEGSDEVRRRVADYEKSLDEFFARLESITDPAAFAAAAKEMPRPPDIEQVTSHGETEPAAESDGSGNSTGGSENSHVVAHTTASTVVVKGLTSFGSITAFKQSLEGVDGVDGVTLSLGPTGEFVYRAVHREGFDLQGAIVALERGSAAVERQDDGTLQVTVARGR